MIMMIERIDASIVALWNVFPAVAVMMIDKIAVIAVNKFVMFFLLL